MGYNFFLQEIFLTQESNHCLLHLSPALADRFFFTTSTTREAHLLTSSFQINSKQLYAITSSISLPQLILLFFSNKLPLTYPPAYKSTLGIFFSLLFLLYLTYLQNSHCISTYLPLPVVLP